MEGFILLITFILVLATCTVLSVFITAFIVMVSNFAFRLIYSKPWFPLKSINALYITYALMTILSIYAIHEFYIVSHISNFYFKIFGYAFNAV